MESFTGKNLDLLVNILSVTATLDEYLQTVAYTKCTSSPGLELGLDVVLR